MANTYPISFPSTTGAQPTSTTFRLMTTVAMTESPYTGAQQVFQYQGNWWEAEITCPPMNHSTAREVIATLTSLRGGIGQILLGDWDGRTARGTASSSAGTPLVNGADQTGNTLVIDGAAASQTGYLKKGDYIQIGSGLSSRLHIVVEDANTDGSGNSTLSIEPELRTSPADDTAITVANAQGVFRLVGNAEWNANAISTYGISFAVKEYLT